MMADTELMEEIPFKHVNYGTMVKLANKLDPNVSVMGNNWRMLAEKLGYSTTQILCFESTQTAHGRNTIKVLEDYIRKAGSTINALMQALIDIERPDALSELEKDIPEIRKKYKESLDLKRRQFEDPQENEYISSTVCSLCMTSQTPYPSIQMDNRQQQMHHCHQKALGHQTNYVCNSNGKTANTIVYNRNNSVPGIQSPHMMPCGGGGAGAGGRVNGGGGGVNSQRKMNEHMIGPSIRRQVSDSMVVHPCDNHTQFMSMEPMDEGQIIRDNPVPLAAGILRARQYDPHCPVNLRGTESDSEIIAAQQSVQTSKPFYQRAEEPRFRQPLPNTNRKLTLSIQPAAERSFQRTHEKMEDDTFYSPSPTPTTPISTPLAHLHELAQGTRFHPNESFNKLMVMKKEQELQQQKEDVKKTEGKMPLGYCLDNEKTINMCSKTFKSASIEAKMKEPPNTFPLRIKSSSCSTTPSCSSPQGLIKSLSMPRDMKPVEYRRAIRNIKVFVTYSADTRRHTQRVINLCKCLEKNGFTCCVDIYHRKLQMQDKVSWYQTRFHEADFILVVVSPKYKHETDSYDTDDDSENMDSDGQNDTHNHQLHTKGIYRLMFQEFLQASNRKLRFVPIMFEGMNPDCIPSWMVQRAMACTYHWPTDYKDLLWMLSKPEERIKPPQNNMSQDEESLDTFSESNNETD